MSLDSRLYPQNWQQISLNAKIQANWQCQCCGKHCIRPEEDLTGRPRSEWAGDLLQTHHRDHNPRSNEESNLICVCAACHLNLHRSGFSPVSPGQLSLW